MNRLSTVIALSLSVIAVVLASFALFQTRSGGERADAMDAEETRELELLVSSLSERVEELEAKQNNTPNEGVRSPGRRMPRRATRSRPEAADLREQVAALSQRLASLEDEETIARLAQSGEEQVVQRQLRSALDQIGGLEVSPEDRLEALENLRRLRKTHWPLVARAMKESDLTERDLVLPMLELAQDRALDPEFRAEVLHNLDSKVPELRRPLLDLLAFEDAPEVREASVEALMYHLGDPAVREAITRASREDRHESVRARAEAYLPKVQYFDRRAADAERAAAGEGK